MKRQDFIDTIAKIEKLVTEREETPYSCFMEWLEEEGNDSSHWIQLTLSTKQEWDYTGHILAMLTNAVILCVYDEDGNPDFESFSTLDLDEVVSVRFEY